jgi:hypothetical protein
MLDDEPEQSGVVFGCPVFLRDPWIEATEPPLSALGAGSAIPHKLRDRRPGLNAMNVHRPQQSIVF